MEKWYVDVNNKQLQSDTWRVPYEENDNYFPEYYVIPVDAAPSAIPPTPMRWAGSCCATA